MMDTQTISPFQLWVEAIHDYLTRGEMIKARFASFVLPVFEAIELFSVLKKLCFRCTHLQSESNGSLLARKASLLMVNLFFSSYYGFCYPKRNYQLLQACGLIHQKVTQEKPLSIEQVHLPTQGVPSPPVQHLITQLKNAPYTAEAQTSFQCAREKIARRVASLTRCRKAENSSERLKFSLDSQLQKSDDAKKDLGPIWAMIQKPIPPQRGGSWKVNRHQQIQFRRSTEFHFDAEIIDILAQAHAKGCLNCLTYEQVLTLSHNLAIIDSYLITKTSDQLAKLINLSQAIYKRLVFLWIQNECQEGLFYERCHQLLKCLLHLARKEHINAETLQFESSYSADFFNIFKKWQEECTSTNLPLFRKKASLTIQQYYAILMTYLEVQASSLQTTWSALRQASSKWEWRQALNRLPPQEQKVVLGLLEVFSITYVHVWKKNLAYTLCAMPTIASLLCKVPRLDLMSHSDVSLWSEMLSLGLNPA